MYQVLLEKTAENDLKRLQEDDFQRIMKIIKSLSQDPRPPGCKKLSGSSNDWRVRVSNHRILYEIDKKEMVVRVMRIKHRKEVYR